MLRLLRRLFRRAPRRAAPPTSTELLLRRVLELRQARVDAGDHGPWDIGYAPLLGWTMHTPWRHQPRSGKTLLVIDRIGQVEGINLVCCFPYLRDDAMVLVPAGGVGLGSGYKPDGG